MEYCHMLLGEAHLGSIQDEAVLNTLVLLKVGEALLLHASHIENVYLANHALDVVDLAVRDAVAVAYIVLDVVG